MKSSLKTRKLPFFIQSIVMVMFGFATSATFAEIPSIHQSKARVARPSAPSKFNTRHFSVEARDAEVARKIGESLERYFLEYSHFYGLVNENGSVAEMRSRCTVEVRESHSGSGGVTTFVFFQGGKVGDFKMVLQGSLEQILDDVIPHETHHMALACLLKKPLPRWFDEGLSTLQETGARRKIIVLKEAQDLLKQGSHISLRTLLPMKDYPKDMQEVLKIYAEGASLCQFLLRDDSDPTHEKLLKFVTMGEKRGWNTAAKNVYGFQDVADLEAHWLDWLKNSDGL